VREQYLEETGKHEQFPNIPAEFARCDLQFAAFLVNLLSNTRALSDERVIFLRLREGFTEQPSEF
jgi:hypothetical protein